MVGWKWRDGDVEAASATDRQDRLAPLAATSSFARGPDALDRFISADLGGLRSRAPGHVPPPTNLVASINPTNAELDARLLDKRQKKKHNVVMNSRVDKLYEVPIPAGWKHSPRFATRTEMRQARHHQSIALHPSYDVDGDGFIGQDDYSIASKHDLGATRMLTGGQRDSAIAESCHRMGSKLNESEIGGNVRVRRLLTSLRDEPELRDTALREGRMRQAALANAALKMKSSQQLKDALIGNTGAKPSAEASTAAIPTGGYTRSMMLEQRKVAKIEMEQTARESFVRATGTSAW